MTTPLDRAPQPGERIRSPHWDTGVVFTVKYVGDTLMIGDMAGTAHPGETWQPLSKGVWELIPECRDYLVTVRRPKIGDRILNTYGDPFEWDAEYDKCTRVVIREELR